MQHLSGVPSGINKFSEIALFFHEYISRLTQLPDEATPFLAKKMIGLKKVKLFKP